MNTNQINKGIKLIKQNSLNNNTTIYSTSINMNVFFNELNIDIKEFIINFNNHPFSIVRGYIMLSNKGV
jgi:hypothetical protein